MEVLVSRHLLPVSSPPVEDGAVAVRDGRIVGAGPRREVLSEHGDGARVYELGDSVVLPGLVNAHLHLELSWAGEEALPRGDYVGWLRELLARREAVAEPTSRRAAEEAAGRMVERGTVAIGDVGSEIWIAPLLARSPLHGVVFHELYGIDAAGAEAALHDAAERLDTMSADPAMAGAGDRLRVALTPHAPHTTSVPLLRALAGRALAAAAPLSIHVAESEAEVRILADGTGPLAELFRERGFAPDGWTPPRRSPVEHLKRLGVLSRRTLAVHCVHLDHQDRSTLQASGVTVVTCPRSNAALGVGKAPIPALLREGVPVALGTDSLASAPDLDLFAEMAALRVEHPSLSPATVLRMATLNGARALGLGERLGSIEPGKLAELAVVPLAEGGDSPLETVCSCPAKAYRLEEAVRTMAEAPS